MTLFSKKVLFLTGFVHGHRLDAGSQHLEKTGLSLDDCISAHSVPVVEASQSAAVETTLHPVPHSAIQHNNVTKSLTIIFVPTACEMILTRDLAVCYSCKAL